MIKPGIVSVSFRQNTPEEILEKCSELGIKYIEWGSDVHAVPTNAKNLESIAKMQEKYGIKCSSYGTYFYIGREKCEEILQYIDAAKALGTNILRLWCGTKGSCDYTDEEKSIFIAECRALADVAERENVLLCTEFHLGSFTDCAESAIELINAVNSPNFKTYWQPNQHKACDFNIETARAVSSITQNIHVFNWRGTEMLPLCDGAGEWKEYFKAFDDGKDRFALLEFMPDGKIETLQREYASLMSILR